jgi:hypothetical protein
MASTPENFADWVVEDGLEFYPYCSAASSALRELHSSGRARKSGTDWNGASSKGVGTTLTFERVGLG